MNKYITLDNSLYDYILAHRSKTADPLYDALRRETAALGDISMMAISPEQATFLSLLVTAVGARRVVEVGTFTGSSALAIARGLPADGRLFCFDVSDEWTSIARRHWQAAGVGGKIELSVGDAAKTLAAWTPPGPVDFAFIDADKQGYDTYYELLLPHVRKDGLIVFDNMLQHGRVVNPSAEQSEDTRAIVALNRKLADDDRVESVLLPIADGLTFCRKI
ncbi:MAG: SAM-dependent methyltransferase [Puniceicoccaceae bacterium]|nr:MAG: SAM-dependent methyltransferase [Puniceicoccaceae bacterium]